MGCNDFGKAALRLVDVSWAGPLRRLPEGVQHLDGLAERRKVHDTKLAAVVNTDLDHAWSDGSHRLPIERSLAGLHPPKLKAGLTARIPRECTQIAPG